MTWDKTLDRMRKEQHAFESAQQQEQKALQAQFRIARWKLQQQCKKDAEEAAEREKAKVAAALQEGTSISPSLTKRRSSLGGGEEEESFSRRGSVIGLGGGGDDSIHGKKVDEEDEEDLQWNYSDGLSAWMWVNDLAAVFSALFTMEDPKALEPLRKHIEGVGEEEAEWFDWLMRISEGEQQHSTTAPQQHISSTHITTLTPPPPPTPQHTGTAYAG